MMMNSKQLVAAELDGSHVLDIQKDEKLNGWEEQSRWICRTNLSTLTRIIMNIV
jgi:hypothetical protein